MSNELHKQVYNNLNLKETDDLLEIWQANNRAEWSDTAFEVIKEVLTKRGLDIPEQDEPVYEQNEEVEDDKFDFNKEELKIIDDENPPDFYDPFEALKISKWLEKAAIASVYVVLISTALQFPKALHLTQSYLQNVPLSNTTVTIIAVTSTSLAVFMVIFTTYLPLKVLSRILRILMQMEFNSRKATNP